MKSTVSTSICSPHFSFCRGLLNSVFHILVSSMAQYLEAKVPVTVESLEQPLSLANGTAEDRYDMTRMGKKQELTVGYMVGKNASNDV